MYKRDIMLTLQNITPRWGSPYVLARQNQIWGGGGGGYRLTSALSSSRNYICVRVCVCVWGGGGDQKDINMWV